MRWLNADPKFVPHLAQVLDMVPTQAACQLSEFKDAAPVAGVLFDGFNGQSIHAHIWMAGNLRPSRLFYWAVCDYAFNQLKVKNVVGTVPSSNVLAHRLDLHMGFVDTARVPAYYPNGDDMIIMVCTRETVFDFERLKFDRKKHSVLTIAA